MSGTIWCSVEGCREHEHPPGKGAMMEERSTMLFAGTSAGSLTALYEYGGVRFLCDEHLEKARSEGGPDT